MHLLHNYFTLLILTALPRSLGANAGDGSIKGGLYQPGCIVPKDSPTNINVACIYQDTASGNDIQRECLSGFWKIQSTYDTTAEVRFYCASTCTVYTGFTPDFISRTCVPSIAMAPRCPPFYKFSLATFYCDPCPPNCLECDDALQKCLSCRNGFYFDPTNKECIPKSNEIAPILRVFVASDNQPSTPNSHSGSSDDPFYDIRDALSFINQASAPYATRQAFIYLEKGTHYINLRDQSTDGFQQTSARDLVQMEYDLTILPLYCDDTDAGVTDTSRCHQPGEKATIRHKLGSYFYFDVPRSLNLTNLIFDAVDSMGTWNLDCIGTNEDTCRYDAATNSILSVKSGCCSEPVQYLEHCNINNPTSFIRIHYSASNALSQPKSLSLINSEFRHFFHHMNSLIQYPLEGANVTIQGSLFEYFSTCGSIVKNRYYSPVQNFIRFNDFFNALVLHVQAFKEYAPSKISQNSYDDPSLFNPFTGPCAAQATNKDCHSATIIDSQFQHFDVFFRNEDDGSQGITETQRRAYTLYYYTPQASTYNETNLYRGGIVQLEQYPGSLIIQNSNFKDLVYPAKPCFSQTYIAPFSFNTDGNLIYLSDMNVKVEMPIIVTRARGSFIFSRNTVSRVSGSKGFMFIEKDSTFDAPSVIYNNTFSRVSGHIFSGILNLRRVLGGVVREYSSSNFCGGFLVQENTFENSVLCPKFINPSYYYRQGLVKFSCRHQEQLFILDQVSDEALPFWTTQGALDYSENLVPIQAYPGISLQVDTRISTFRNNTFSQNFRGARGSLILVQNIPFFRIINNTYSKNQDVLLAQFGGVDIQNNYGAFKSSPVEQMYRSSEGSFSHNTEAIITVVTGGGIQIIGDKFGEDNWKDDLNFQYHAAYLHTIYTRGKFIVSEMEVTSPPQGVCSSAVQSLATEQAIYESKCGSSRLPNQAYEPFFKFQFFNDESYSSATGEYQTEFVISSFSLYNFTNALGNPFLVATTNLKYVMVHFNLTSVTLSGSKLNGESLLDLRSIFTDINGLVLRNLGTTTSTVDHIFIFGDLIFSSKANRFSIRGLELENVHANKSIISVMNESDGEIDVSISDFSVSSSYAMESLFTVNAPQATVSLEGWNVREFSIGNITSLFNYQFVLTSYAQLSISGFTHVCSLAKSNCRVLRLNNEFLSLSISDSDFSMSQSNGVSVASGLGSSPFKIICNELTMANNRFHGFQRVADQGGVFTGLINSLTDNNSSYYQNKGAEEGGVFHVTQISHFNFTNSQFYDNEAVNGGVFQLQNSIFLTLNNCTFNGNRASNTGGALRIFGSSIAKVYSSSFYNNSADNEGAVMFFLFSETENDFSVIQDSIIHSNRLPKGRNPVSILYSKVLFKNVSFYENLALQGSHNLYIGFSQVNLTESRFFVEDEAFEYLFSSSETQESIVANSAGLSVGENAEVIILDTSFENVATGGMPSINVQGYSVLNITNSTFINLEAKFQGGAVQASGFQRVNVTGSHLFQNEFSIQASGIISANSSSTLQIYNSTFNSTLGTSVYLSEGDLLVAQSLFTSQNPLTSAGGRHEIECVNCKTMNLQLSNFTSINVDSVLHIQNSSLAAVHSSQEALIFVKDSIFQNIVYSSNGGAISVDNYDLVLLEGNTFGSISYHQSTTTQLKGGAIYTQGQDLRNFRLKTNTFRGCEALIGGAIYYAHHQPQIQEDNTFSSNVAQIYGDDIAAYPVRLGFADEAALTRQLSPFDFSSQYASYSLQPDATLTDFSFSDVQSGGALSTFYVVVLDKFGQIVRSQSSNRLTVSLELTQSSAYSPVASLSSDLYCQNGVFNVTGLSTILQPGTSVAIKIGAIDLFDSTLPDVADFHSSNGQSLDLKTTVTARTCLPGEAFLANGECATCSDSEYKLEATIGPSNCLACPQRANCFGGSSIGPKPTFWRASNTSINFYSCLNPDACLGRLSPSDSELGECAEGYRGILCAQCEADYSRDSQFQCVGCPARWKNILFISLISLGTLVGVVLFVKFTISSALSQRSPFSIYLKVLINHLQLVFLTSSFDLSWPDQVNAFYEQTRPVASVGDQILSLDCLLAHSTIHQIGRFYIYLLAYAIMPIVVAFLSLLFWWLKIRTDRRRVCNRSTATIIIILFLLHPSITATMFSAFYCRDVDGTLRLVQELDQVCWEGRHFWWALLGGVPGLLCWAIGIPGFAWLVLSEHKQQLANTNMREKFGFLYKGYKLDSFYWECLIMYRKVAMIFISVFLNGIGAMVQALVVLLLLIFFILLTLHKKPYHSRKLNDLEIVSLVTSCIAFYCGLYFLSSKSPDDPSFVTSKDFFLGYYSKWFFFCVIVLANLCFFVFWLSSLLGQVRHKLREKCTRFYVCLCLCCRKGLLKEDQRNAKKDEAQELVIETIEQVVRSLRSVQSMYIRKREFVGKNKFEGLLFKFNRELQKVDTSGLLRGRGESSPAFLGRLRVTPSDDPLFYLPQNKERRKQKQRIEKENSLEILPEQFEQTEDAQVMVIGEDPHVLKKQLKESARRSKPYEELAIELGDAKRGPPSPEPGQVEPAARNLYDSVNTTRTHKTFNTSINDSGFVRQFLSREKSLDELNVDMEDMFEQGGVFYKLNSGLPQVEEEKREDQSERRSVKDSYMKLRRSASHLREYLGNSTQTLVTRKPSRKMRVHPEDVLESEDNYKIEAAHADRNVRQIETGTRRFNSTSNKLRTVRYAEREQTVEEVRPLTTEDLSHLVQELDAVSLGREGSEPRKESS